MPSIHYKNEVQKRNFYTYLGQSKGFSAKSISSFEKAIWLWEDYSDKADFANFNKTKAEEFKNWLKDKKKVRTEVKVSLSYCYDMLRYLKVFFEWLSKQPGYRSKINSTDIEYLNLTKAEVRIATQSKVKDVPTLEEIKTVIESIQGKTEIEMRDKALISLMLLTGIRISALASLPMGSLDREKLVIDQDPKLGVKTKFSKHITSVFIPLPYSELKNYVLEWFDCLEKEKKFQPNDPLFPATKVETGKENFSYYNTEQVESTFWKGPTPIRKILGKRFIQAGVKYYHPHSFRDLLVKEISKLPLTEEQKKAFSQNLGHEDVGTTFGSYGYGHIEPVRQIEILKGISFEETSKE